MHDLAALRSALLDWYRANRRDLPWRRRNGDPYAIWISEVMLQQTRVDTVIPYYEKFLDRWPTVRALAEADPADVRAAWSGLGYYRRARLMLDAAASVVRDHAGALPRELDALRALPGFGRYTAGAVGSIAFGIEAPAVDGNVARVFARLFGIEGDVAEVWKKAEAIVPGESPGDLNQALIELGALVCTPKAPKCMECPVSRSCVALEEDRVHELPPPKKRAVRGRVEVTALLILDAAEREVLLEKQPEGGLFAELWCLPMLEGKLELDAVRDEAERKYGFQLDRIDPLFAEVKHVLTHRDIEMRIVRAHAKLRLKRGALERIALDSLDQYGVPSLTVRALRASLPKSALRAARLPGRATKASSPPLTLFPDD